MKIYAFADESSASVEGQIDALKRNKLDGLEIRNVDGTNVSEITIDKAKEVKNRLKSEGLKVWSVGSPIGKIDIKKDDFNKHIELFKHTLSVANALEAGNMRIFSFYIPEDEIYDDYKNEVIDRLGTLLELSAGSGVDLCHENEKGIFGDNEKRCKLLFESLPSLKGIFDPANFVQCGVDTLFAWEELKEHIKYLHIKDSLKSGEIVPAGEGDGNIGQIIKAYKAFGGNAVTLEPHLAVFDGLAALEREGEKSNVGGYKFESNEAAFDAACKALEKIL